MTQASEFGGSACISSTELYDKSFEVSARLSTSQEVRQLIKVLRAGILIFAIDAEADIPENFTPRCSKAASLKVVSW